MSEIIERAAEALRRLPVRDFGEPGGELDELRRREAVRAVLLAIREPTEAMLVAGDQHMGEISYPNAAWQAMIDAALKSKRQAEST